MVVFRVDGGATIGAGHVMRCLSIAEALREKGQVCMFIMASDTFAKTVTGHGHKVMVLDTDYSNMESEDILPALNACNPLVVIVDSYYVTDHYMKKLHNYLRERGAKLIYVDDRCEFPYSCDAVLNYNIFGNEEDYRNLYKDVQAPDFLLGTGYAPLRKEFMSVKKEEAACHAGKVFVSTGGADPEHLTVALLKEAGNSDLHYTFVVGSMNPDKEAIRRIASEYENITIKENVSNMSEVMLSCDVAISAAGSTLYELCVSRTPTITYVLAENQIPAARCFEKKGIMKYCGDIRELGKETLAHKLIETAEELAADCEKRLKMSEFMRTVTDGNGAERLADLLISYIGDETYV